MSTTESVVETKVIEEPQEKPSTKEVAASGDHSFRTDLIRIGVATLVAAILFGIVGYLALKTQVIENWSQQLLDWFRERASIKK